MTFAIHNNISVISWRSVVSLFVIGNTGMKFTDCLEHFTTDGDCTQQQPRLLLIACVDKNSIIIRPRSLQPF